MNFETVEYTLDNSVATIRMARPEALNALSSGLTRDLDAAIRRASAERARVAILTGSGRAFCSGGDLREMQQIGQAEGRIEAFLEAPLQELHELITLIRTTPIPFIAAVNGVCAGAGTNLALACDIVIASRDATFNEAFVRIGLTPDCGGTYFLPRAIGEKKAAELLMTGDSIAAEAALEMGMINRVVEAEKLEGAAQALAANLAAGPTAGIGRIKRMLNASYANTLEQQLALEHECQIESGRAADFREGVTAFFEKRPPRFSGE
jgi:2-(1,2-epoxy-1,2-dihydrophenyl)acetyl-CoA isomerase